MQAHVRQQPPPPTEDDAARAELQRIIDEEDLSIALQPIVQLRTGKVIGCEALTRLNDASRFGNTGLLFDAAGRLGMYAQLEAVCRRLALRRAAELDPDVLLFMNNSPAVIANPGFVDDLLGTIERTSGITPRRLVIEITERTDQDDLEGLDARTAALREHGFEIALDDVGAGISGLNRIMLLRPSWVKLDRQLIAHIDQDPLRQNLLRSLLQFVKLSSMSLIAEGIERYEELAVLVEMGVPLGQGFFLAKPTLGTPAIDDEVRASIDRLTAQVDARRFEHPSTVRVATLARPLPSVQRDEPIGEVLATLSKPTGPDAAIVLDGRRFVGIIGRGELEAFVAEGTPATPIGAISTFDDIVIGAEATLSEALELAAARSDDAIARPLAVQDEGRVLGILSLRELLQSAAQGHRHLPAHLAALTQLPSRVQADAWIADGIRSGRPSNVAFIDLRDFDAYNLAYGFDMGDAMLLRLVEHIRTAIHQDGDRDVLLAHLGEDRFVAAFDGDRREAMRRIGSDFRESLSELFSTKDLESGGFTCVDPSGRGQRYPLTSVRVVYLERPLQHVASPRELHELAHTLRLTARDDFGGVIFDRRRSPRVANRSA